jgi:hypothetical protein
VKITRNEFLRTLSYASATVAGGHAFGSTITGNSGASVQAPSAKKVNVRSKIKLGVSLYSYQHAIYTREMTTEECLAELNSIGAEGVQLINEVTIPNYPNPPGSWVDQWFGWMEKYKLTPTLLDTFVDVYWGGRHAPMSLQESIDTLVMHLKLAKRLGFTVVRPTSRDVQKPYPELFEGIVPHAEKLNVKVAPELHSPIPLKMDGAFVSSILEIVLKTGTQHLGFALDMGDLPLGGMRPMGAAQGGSQGGAPSGGSQGGAPQGPQDSAMMKMMMASAQNSPQDVKPLVPYIFNIHGKFTDMTSEQTHKTYEETFKILVEEGYNGYIDSEYEGQRGLQNQWCIHIDEAEQVRQHHVMMRKLLGMV